MLGVPVVIWDKLDKPHGWFDWLQLPLVTRNIVICYAVASKYPRWQKSLFNHKIERVFEGVDFSTFDRYQSLRNDLPADSDSIYMAIVGTITRRKGHHRVFDALPKVQAEIPNLHLLVIGEVSGNSEDDEYKDDLKLKSNERVHYLGFRNDVGDLMKSIDILLVPSLNEGTPLVINEAMAASVPVVGSRAGGIPEVVVDGETGYLFDGDDTQQLAKCIIELSKDCQLRQKMGTEGRRRAELKFNRSVQMKRVVEILEGAKK
ncbi:glycosyltransferase family 4 protein [Rubritalea tangerina]